MEVEGPSSTLARGTRHMSEVKQAFLSVLLSSAYSTHLPLASSPFAHTCYPGDEEVPGVLRSNVLGGW